MTRTPCFRGSTTALVGSLLVLALMTAACSSGSSPSASPSGGAPAISTAPSQPASPAASGPPASTEAPATVPPATQPPPTETSTPATPAPSATPSGPPPAPSGIDYRLERGIEGEGGRIMTRYVVSWSAPLDPGTSIRVYGVLTCPAKRTPSNPPCVAESTRLPAKIRELIVMGPATDGSISWDWPEADVDGPVLAIGPDGTSFYAFVVRAVNDAGRSPFVVVRSTVACSDCMS